ncbi:hypothetical protein DPMN_124202 [Dreissena polymorpha]|uniref:Uncharacterized protein n=1 Tax=Dreissena polymorpha TaxID=45954 RepID=A0A9D4JTM1_DREPO|nr:hypothetical protein DPMN_124202 [Dreissena polymorpha]
MIPKWESICNVAAYMHDFSASMLYTGYLDDPRNTDNAWVEAEVWNFHFDVGDTFDLTFSQVRSFDVHLYNYE